MNTEQLNFYGAWASIASILVGALTLWQVGSVRRNIINFRRRERTQQLIRDIALLSRQTVLAPAAIRYKLESLRRTVRIYPWSRWTAKGRTAIELHLQITDMNLPAIEEVLKDWNSFSEDL
jgi:hypothetical protein